MANTESRMAAPGSLETDPKIGAARNTAALAGRRSAAAQAPTSQTGAGQSQEFAFAQKRSQRALLFTGRFSDAGRTRGHAAGVFLAPGANCGPPTGWGLEGVCLRAIHNHQGFWRRGPADN